ncbi:hypothetical protein Tco_0490898 [Tanacetum coccineum]
MMVVSNQNRTGDCQRDLEKTTNSNAASATKETELAAGYTNLDNHDINKVWRESSYEFRNEGGKIDFVTSGTPSPQQSMALSSLNNYGILTPQEVKISFQDEVFDQPVRRRSNGVGGGGSSSEVLICSGNASFT